MLTGSDETNQTPACLLPQNSTILSRLLSIALNCRRIGSDDMDCYADNVYYCISIRRRKIEKIGLLHWSTSMESLFRHNYTASF